MLGNLELQQLRAAARMWLKDRCTIEVETSAVGEMGEPLEGWDVVADDIPCRVIKAGWSNADMTEIIGSQETMAEMYKAALPVGTPIGIDQRLTVGGATYDVVHVETALTDAVMVHAWIIRRR